MIGCCRIGVILLFMECLVKFEGWGGIGVILLVIDLVWLGIIFFNRGFWLLGRVSFFIRNLRLWLILVVKGLSFIYGVFLRITDCLLDTDIWDIVSYRFCGFIMVWLFVVLEGVILRVWCNCEVFCRIVGIWCIFLVGLLVFEVWG